MAKHLTDSDIVSFWHKRARITDRDVIDREFKNRGAVELSRDNLGTIYKMRDGSSAFFSVSRIVKMLVIPIPGMEIFSRPEWFVQFLG